jgi:peroxiredoxin
LRINNPEQNNKTKNMKKIVYLLVIVTMITACKTKPGYVISGNLGAKDSTMVYLHAAGDAKSLDSAMVNKGTFKMKGSVDYPQMVVLTLKGARGGKMFFIENSEITFTGHVDSIYTASVTGSASQSEYETYLALFDDLNKQMEYTYESYKDAFQKGNQHVADSLENELNALDEKMLVIKKDYITAHPASYITPSILGDISYYLEVPEMESILGSLDTSLNKVTRIVTLKERLETMKSVQIGQKAPDFALNDVNGTPVPLSSMFNGKTKLLLVDFWASWCGPCRQENPNVVKVWSEFHKKGFDVFGVSLDSKAESWKAAIESDKLTWTHVSDLQYWNSAAAKLYAVNAIPSNFLLDGNGIIIAHNLRGEDLYKKVKEVLGGK